ncbi:ATP-dependent DNA helicase Q-like 3 isoform X1 [Paramuricea clavata]|uniref:ATP-dependent DNA helicase Q-like 3 isoform X1 n=1 Tax=Paramuricea clavata TaxID=317549 RepID=A0A6S7HYJ2_PARCT|nr:ATP-dependent DNA helicase Q-like 3 isoform X1 [Paramuricea clavata]
MYITYILWVLQHHSEDGKLPCPHRSCKSNSVKVFFEEKGIAQHFRTKHSGIVFDEEKQLRDARRIFRFSHGEETKQHLEILSKQRQFQSNDYERFSISTRYEACLAIDLVAKCPQECAKLVGMLLMHYGQLRSYSEGAKPEILELTGNKILDTLRQVFKHEKFRGKQQEAIESVINGHYTLLIMPTGCGKTACYAVPAVMENKVAVVVFPLLALLLDQAERLRRKGMNVCYLMTDMEEEEREIVIHKLDCNPPEYNFFFVTPETVLTPAVLTLLQNLSSRNLLGLVVIDEAHCIDTWGFHFRPSYAEVWKLCHLGSPILAMTGTATTRTQSVILNSLYSCQRKPW